MATDLAPLIAQLKSADMEQKLAAAEALCHLGEDARPAALQLIDAVRSDDERVCEAAIAALEGLGAPPTTMTSDIAVYLADTNASRAFWAATLLGRIGSDAAEATERLASTTADVNAPAEVRQKAAWALGKIGPQAKSALGQLRSVDCQGDARLKRMIDSAVKSIG